MGPISLADDELYAVEKFSNAVYALATGKGLIKTRLLSAFIEFSIVRERDIPEELRPEFVWIKTELTSKEAKGVALINGKLEVGIEGRIGATLRTMRIKKAVHIAHKICDFSYNLNERLPSVLPVRISSS